MALLLVSTPIGDPGDFTLRGLETLRRVSTIIVEERKESSAWLRSQGISGKHLELCNEHSNGEDLDRLAGLCAKEDVALITDCGSPGFCDPGAELVRRCRQSGVPVKVFPGASSLTALLSLSSERLDQFYFRGFLPANTEKRREAWRRLGAQKGAIVLMDTPYRLGKTLEDLKSALPKRKILLALNLTQETEQVLEGRPEEIAPQVASAKAEFMLLIYPES